MTITHIFGRSERYNIIILFIVRSHLSRFPSVPCSFHLVVIWCNCEWTHCRIRASNLKFSTVLSCACYVYVGKEQSLATVPQILVAIFEPLLYWTGPGGIVLMMTKPKGRILDLTKAKERRSTVCSTTILVGYNEDPCSWRSRPTVCTSTFPEVCSFSTFLATWWPQLASPGQNRGHAWRPLPDSGELWPWAQYGYGHNGAPKLPASQYVQACLVRMLQEERVGSAAQ